MDEIIKASQLYHSALKENQVELPIPLGDCKIVFVEDMPRHHRSSWVEDSLFIFCHNLSEEINDSIIVSDTKSGTRRRLHIMSIDFNASFGSANNIIDYHMIMANCNNHMVSFSRSLRPKYTEISSKQILKTIKLLPFV